MYKRSVLYLFLLIPLMAIASTGGGMLRFNRYTVDDGLSQNTINAIAKDRYGFMWFGTWEGVCRFDGYTFRTFRAEEDNPNALTNNRINAIVTDTAGNIWIATGDKRYIFRYNFPTESFTRYASANIPPAVQRRLSAYGQTKKSAENKLFKWEASSQGLIRYNKENNRQSVFLPNPKSTFALSDNAVTTLYLDDNSNLWVGTQNGGINIANLKFKQFDYYTVDNTYRSDRVIRAICQDKTGKLWVGTETGGITVIDRSRGNTGYVFYGKNKLIDTNIRHLYCDHLGFMWIGTKGGLDRFDPLSGKFRHYYAGKPGSIQNPNVFQVTEDHSGTIWVGTFEGIAKYDRLNDRFITYEWSNMILNKNVRSILEDQHHNLWIATEGGGITCLKRQSSSLSDEKLIPHHYTHQAGNKNSLINNMALTLALDKDQKLWVGTNSGLCRLDPLTGQFVRFSVATGFPDDLIMGLQSDGNNHLWISHKKGLTCMDIHTFRFRTYNRFDGLQGNEFSQNACYRNKLTGEMFFGGTNGLNAFFPQKIASNPVQPHPVLTGLKIMNQPVEVGNKVNNRVVLQKSLLATDKIILTAEEVNFSIVFSALLFDNPQGCLYKYKLKGIDDKWMYTDGSMHEATFTHLPAGTYTFILYAANSDGVWSDRPATVQIRILPPWWWTWWSKLMYFLIFGLAAWLVYRFVASRLELKKSLLIERLKNEKNEELMNMKLQFFTEISHEFRTPLTLIIDPLERLLEGKTDEEQTRYYYQLMNRNAKQLLELINQLLDFRKLQSKNLPLKFITTDLIGFVQNIAAAFEHKASEKQIRFAVLTTEKELMADFDTDKMRKILNNLISNALRFTPRYGEIVIRLSRSNDYPEKIRIEVQDNGPGIAPEHQYRIFDAFYQVEGAKSDFQGSGLGLTLTKELVLLHHGEISLISDKGKGCCFVILIPVKQEVTTEPTTSQEETAALKATEPDEYASEPETTGKEQPLLLVVDDNEDIRNYVTLNFNKSYRISTACDGSEGFIRAIESIPDIIISDIMMPGVDGIELCRRLKTDEHTSHIPVILLTAKQSDESRIEGYETGADAYITKPFNKKVLESRLRNLLEQRAKLRQLFTDGNPSELRKISVNVTDEAFLTKAASLVDQNMEDPYFDTDQLVGLMKMSRSQLYRKIKALTNRTVHEFITTLRMNKARELLLSGNFTVSETAYKVGYSLPTNFTRTFTKQFGLTPTQYIESHKK